MTPLLSLSRTMLINNTWELFIWAPQTLSLWTLCSIQAPRLFMWSLTSASNARRMKNSSKGIQKHLRSLMGLLSTRAMALEVYRELGPKTLSALAKDLTASLM